MTMRRSVAARYGLSRLLVVLALLCVVLPGARACAICAPSDAQNTLLARLAVADAVVLARATSPGVFFEALEVVKGAAPVDRIQVGQWMPGPAPLPGAPVVLLYNAAAKQWSGWGNLPLARSGWLKRLVALSSRPTADWTERLALFLPDLEAAEPLVSQVAYDEIAVAPYSVMRLAKSRLRPEQLWRWLRDPALVARRPLYTLLLGISGSAEHARAFDSILDAAGVAPTVPVLSATLAALIEIRGDVAVQQIESAYFANAQRSEVEVQAAVLALAVHGNDGVRVARERVVTAFGLLVRRQPALAGFVASDLAAWGRWELGTDYAAILKSGQPLVFASRYAMVFFLLRSPRPQDRKAVQELRAARVL